MFLSTIMLRSYSPYVGIIRIRLWVGAKRAPSQPASCKLPCFIDTILAHLDAFVKSRFSQNANIRSLSLPLDISHTFDYNGCNMFDGLTTTN